MWPLGLSNIEKNRRREDWRILASEGSYKKKDKRVE